MSGLEYDNWDESGEDIDYSMSSTSDKGKSPGKASGGDRRTDQGQDYLDISVEDDDDIDFGGYDPTVRSNAKDSSASLSSTRAMYNELGPTSSIGSKKPTPSRRMSTDDRMKEILARQQLATSAAHSAFVADDPTKYTSDPSKADPAWEQMRASILEGVEVTNTKKPVPSNARSPGGDSSVNSSVLDASDSFELDDTDLQVGAYAARRSVEKTSERLRRSSINYEDITKKASTIKDLGSSGIGGGGGKIPTSKIVEIEEVNDETPARMKVDESPNVRRANRRQSYNTEGVSGSKKEVPGFQMSQALSSIEYGERRSMQDFGSVESDEMLRYGSVERSDGELYNILNRQSSSEQSLSQSFQSDASQTKRRARNAASVHSGEGDDDDNEDYSNSSFEFTAGEKEMEQKEAEQKPSMTTLEEIQARWSNPESVLTGVKDTATAASKETAPMKSTSPMELGDSKYSPAAANISTGEASTSPVALDTKAIYADAVAGRYGLDNTADSSVLRGSKSEETAASSSMASMDASASEVSATSEKVPVPKYEEIDQPGENNTPDVTTNSATPGATVETITPVPVVSSGLKDAELAATVKVTKPTNDAVVTKIDVPVSTIVSPKPAATETNVQDTAPEPTKDEKGYGFPTYRSTENPMENVQIPSTLELPVWDAEQLQEMQNTNDGYNGNEDEKAMEEEPIIYYSANSGKNNEGNGKNDRSITSQYRLNKSKASPARSLKTSHGQSVAKISAVEVNPAFFGYKAEEDKPEAPIKASFQGKRMEGPVPVLPPNLTELRAQLRVLHSNKKRKVSPVKRTAPSRGTPQSGIPIRSVAPAPVRPQTSRVSSTTSTGGSEGGFNNRSRHNPHSRLYEQPSNSRNASYASTRIMRGGRSTRSQSPRPKPMPLDDKVASGASPARRSQSSSTALRGSYDASFDRDREQGEVVGSDKGSVTARSSSSRLALQFSELEAQVASVQKMQQEMQASVKGNHQAISANYQAINALASGDPPSSAPLVSSSQPTLSLEPLSSRSGANSLRRSSTVLPPAAASSYDAATRASGEYRRNHVAPLGSNDVLQSMIETLRESSHLSLREVAVHEREKSLADRETRLVSRDVRRSHAQMFDVKEVEQQAEEYRDKEKEYMTRESRLRQELESMKASMFKLQQEKDAALARLPKFSAPQGQEWLTDDGQEAKPFDGDAIKNETVTIPRSEYEKMTKELQFQESLLSGFQKENDKLAAQLKDREAEEAYRTSKYFDERERLNKELNRLRNVVGVSVGGDGEDALNTTHGHPYIQKADDGLKAFVGVQRSSELLRADLEKDAMIQGLQDRLLEDKAEASLRMKELQEVIDKLRVENKRLEQTSQKAAMSNLEHMDLKASYLTLQKEKRHTVDELEKLKEKLRWYGENQELLEDADSEKLDLRNTIMNLKKEINSIKSGGAKGAHDVSDISMISLGGGNSSRKGRDPADVKKIEDLKKALTDLQEGMNKRYPDSVSSLIQASKLSDSVQKEQEEKDRKLTKTTEELKKVKDEYDRRLRSLRQEHEKVKMGYEERIKNLQDNQTPSSSSSSSSAATPPKTLNSANAKIKELEKEVERIRGFYTKKLDETTRKFETQIRALKRGDDGNVTQADTRGAVKEITAKVTEDGNVTVPAAAISQFQTQIEMLEKELMSTAEELGKQKAIAEQAINTADSVKAELAGKASIAPIPVGTADTVNAEDASRSLNQHIPTMPNLSLPTPMPPSPPPAQLTVVSEANEGHMNDLNNKIIALSSELASSRNEATLVLKQMDTTNVELKNLRSKLEDTKDELQRTKIELINLQAKEAQSAPKKAISLLESQVNRLEEKILRREKELQGMLDEAKAAAKLELSRLKSIHSQELVEKDQQLARFQRELEELVGALRRYSLRGVQDPTSLKVNDVNVAVAGAAVTMNTPVESR